MKLSNYKFITGITPWLFSIVVAIAGTGPSFAYEVSTHQEMSRLAYSRSVLDTDASLMNDLGIRATEPFLNSNFKDRFILELVLDGSEFEDAIFAIDPDDEDLRMKHHFYNQQNGGRSLVYPPLGLGPNALIKTYSSADWALEDLSEIPEQNFSLNDAYDSFYKALTDIPNRKIHWGWVFQSLGHAIHHVQDMAQPQHTRNDAHTPLEDAERKLYESYTKEKEEEETLYLGYPDIDIEQFTSARMFWDGVNTAEGKGLSEFSSENFVSEGTNFSGGDVAGTYVVGANPVSGQALPTTDNLKITSTEQFFNFTIPTSWLLQTGFPFPFTDITVSGTRHDIGTQVTDYHYAANSDFNEKTSTFSVIDSDLDAIDSAMIYALDRTNYDEAHKFLIPKAVSYSAGLIDYFFRGRIEANISEDGDSIEIKNVSKGNFEFGVADVFEVYYETDSGTRNPLNNLSNLLLVSGLPVNGTHTITGLSTALQGVPDLGIEGKIIVLFDGAIGSERGIATTTVEVDNPFPIIWQGTTSGVHTYTIIESGSQFFNRDYISQRTVVAEKYIIDGVQIVQLFYSQHDVIDYHNDGVTDSLKVNAWSFVNVDPYDGIFDWFHLNRPNPSHWSNNQYNFDTNFTSLSNPPSRLSNVPDDYYTWTNGEIDHDERLNTLGPIIANIDLQAQLDSQPQKYKVAIFFQFQDQANCNVSNSDPLCGATTATPQYYASAASLTLSEISGSTYSDSWISFGTKLYYLDLGVDSEGLNRQVYAVIIESLN